MNYGEWRTTPGMRWFWGTLTAAILLLLAALAVAALIATIGGDVYALLVLVITAALAYLAGLACSRVNSAGVSIGAEEVVVVGPLRTVRVPTRHADVFVAEVRPGGLGSGQPTIALRYDNSRSIGLWAFNRYASAAKFDELVAELEPRTRELNAALAQAKLAAGVVVPVGEQTDTAPA
jgi:hypothetical protein